MYRNVILNLVRFPEIFCSNDFPTSHIIVLRLSIIIILLHNLYIAGGLATYLHADAVKDYLPTTAKYRAFPDAGYNLIGYA